MKKIMVFASIATAIMVAPNVAAQNDRFAKVEIKTEKVAPNVAILFGAGGNIGVSYGEDGTVMIDDQFAPLTEKINVAVDALGADPVKFLINTHWHGDHTGGNENLGNQGALIMAQHNVRVRMASPQSRGERIIPASPKAALPVVTYSEGIQLHLNGEAINIMGVAPAHTDGDSIIHWTQSNVIHMGDLFFHKMSFPFIDLNSGGDARGVVTAADKALALADDNTVIVPGHGQIADKAALQEYRDMVAEIIAKVETAIADGQTLDKIKASRPADGYDVNPKGFITPDRFVEAIYKSLTAK